MLIILSMSIWNTWPRVGGKGIKIVLVDLGKLSIKKNILFMEFLLRDSPWICFGNFPTVRNSHLKMHLLVKNYCTKYEVLTFTYFWILERSRCFLESVFLNLLWHMRPVGCHKFAQEITVYVISMANLRHNHEAMNKMNIIQVANLHLHCWSGEQTKFQGKHTLE